MYCKMTRKPVQQGGWNGKNLETVIFCLNASAGPSCRRRLLNVGRLEAARRVRWHRWRLGAIADRASRHPVVSLNFRDEVMTAQYHKIRASQGTKSPAV